MIATTIAKTVFGTACLGIFALIAWAGGEARGTGYTNARYLPPSITKTLPPLQSQGGSDLNLEPQLAVFAAACSDPTDNCGDPVKYLGKQNGCACFACRYATSNQQTVCTDNPDAQNKLLKRAK